ncbi:MAG: hypothetical protein EXX96DRAFT_557156, partial [Benjaminiella poitrasii]
MMTENKQLISITVILILFFTLFYIFYTPTFKSPGTLITAKTHLPQDLENSSTNHLTSSPSNKKSFTICDKVDIPWMASDRVYWNGWNDKATFMKSDGTFTKGNVYIQEGEQVCIVVLLGPTPAKSSIESEDHLGPKDSIVLFAKGQNTTLTITELEQHPTQPNAYFAPVRFSHPDVYQLHGLNEYRSYFWESPILHTYRPFQFISENKLIVQQREKPQLLPECNTTSIRGAWVDSTVFSQKHTSIFYSMFENSESEFMDQEDSKIFVPDECHLTFKSTGYAARCLNKKSIHIWADDNIKRNLKALHFNGQQWCDDITSEQLERPRCDCHEDDDDPALYPWAHDPSIPFVLNNALGIHTEFYYNTISENIVYNAPNILNRIKSVDHNNTADIVVIGLGNKDIEGFRILPEQFAYNFRNLITTLRHEIYPRQKIIVRTPQYYCCGAPLKGTSWNNGRSVVFTKIIRQIVQGLENVFVWDVHMLGTDENTCLSEGTSYSRRHVVHMENQLLWHLLCPIETVGI